MGLNAYFAFTMVPELGGNWQLALGIVFLSGALFLLISLTPLREWLINAVPLNLKLGIAAGIGLFLALIGLQNAGLVAADATTLVKLGDLTEAKALLAIAGFLAIAGLAARKVPGAIIFGVIAVTLAAVWPGAARPDRSALRHGACAPLRGLPHGHEPRRDPMGRADRIHPGAHHRADDPL
jgi:AGZA family xanthine/uracil permease-like MFS transporter